ncbi:MAG: DapH/DapD/GlmU-related protein [Bacteroidia bacterium]
MNKKSVLDIIKSKESDCLVLGNLHENIDLKLASLKNIIENGIYYLLTSSIENISEIKDSLIITDQNNDQLVTNNCLVIVKNPQLTFYKLCHFFKPLKGSGIHPTAILTNVTLGKNVSIGPYCVLDSCTIGDNCLIHSHVVINNSVIIGNDVEIQSQTTIGADGVAWIWDTDGTRIVQPQFGGVIIEDNCFLGTDITIVRGSLSESTRIGKGTLIAHGTKIGHGCKIHPEVHFANNVSLAGNAEIEERVFLGSACVISSNVKVRKGCIIGAGAVVNKTIDCEYATIAGVPAKIILMNNFESKPNGAPKPIKI